MKANKKTLYVDLLSQMKVFKLNKGSSMVQFCGAVAQALEGKAMFAATRETGLSNFKLQGLWRAYGGVQIAIVATPTHSAKVLLNTEKIKIR